jgi:hypothetical protein
MSKIAVPGGDGNSKNQIVGKLRIGDLNKIFAGRYGRGAAGRENWQFPNDDSGLEDLKILIHTYHWTNPLKMPRIIDLRAPWADAQAILDEVEAYPRSWKSGTLGQLLNYSGPEWRRQRPRTIAPVDMTPEDRKDFSRILSNGKRKAKRARSGMKTRAEYESQSLSKTKPWVVEGVSRATWYRRRTEIETGLARIKIVCTDQTCLTDKDGQPLQGSKLGLGGAGNPPIPLTPLPDLSNFNPQLTWLCLRAAYHQQMNQICDQVANAKAA